MVNGNRLPERYHSEEIEARRPEPPRPNFASNPVVRFVGFATLFNLLLWLLALFVQIRGWVNVTASYFILFAIWVVGVLISLAAALGSRIQHKSLAVTTAAILWAFAVLALNTIAPKPTETKVIPAPTSPPANSVNSQPTTFSPRNTSVLSDKFSLFLNCQIANLPITFPPESTIHTLNPDFPRELSVVMTGPNETKFPRPDFAGLGYRCEVWNYNKGPVLNITGTFKVMARDVVRSGLGWRDGKLIGTEYCQVKIPVIEANGKWDFYLFNLNGARFVEVVPPTYVTFEPSGASGRAKARLKRNTDVYAGHLLLSGPTPPPPAPTSEDIRTTDSVAIEVRRAKPEIEISFTASGEASQRVPLSVFPKVLSIEPQPTTVESAHLPKEVSIADGTITFLAFGKKFLLVDTHNVVVGSKIRGLIIDYESVR
jgi:hypothetical protein